MVRHWQKTRERGWKARALMNGVGAARDLRRDGRRHHDQVRSTARGWSSSPSRSRVRVPGHSPALPDCRAAASCGQRSRSLRGEPTTRSSSTSSISMPPRKRRSGTRHEISGGHFHAVHVPGGGTAIPASGPVSHQFEGATHLEVVPGEDGPSMLCSSTCGASREEKGASSPWSFRKLFRRRSLASALRRKTFPLKLRLVDEPGVVVADVPRFEGDSPSRSSRAAPSD